jgi:hypothetical protein
MKYNEMTNSGVLSTQNQSGMSVVFLPCLRHLEAIELGKKACQHAELVTVLYRASRPQGICPPNHPDNAIQIYECHWPITAAIKCVEHIASHEYYQVAILPSPYC